MMSANKHLCIARRNRRYSQRRKRRGVVLIVVLMSLMVISIVGSVMIRNAVESHRQTRRELQRLQVQLLAESGLQRAVARLQAAPDYRGEKWEIELKPEGGAAAIVEISIETPTVQPGMRRVQVNARMGAGRQQIVARRDERLTMQPGDAP